jgi:hypothetical protein
MKMSAIHSLHDGGTNGFSVFIIASRLLQSGVYCLTELMNRVTRCVIFEGAPNIFVAAVRIDVLHRVVNILILHFNLLVGIYSEIKYCLYPRNHMRYIY